MFSWIYACQKGWDRGCEPARLLLFATRPRIYRRGPLWAVSVSGNGVGLDSSRNLYAGFSGNLPRIAAASESMFRHFPAQALRMANGVVGVTLAIGNRAAPTVPELSDFTISRTI